MPEWLRPSAASVVPLLIAASILVFAAVTSVLRSRDRRRIVSHVPASDPCLTSPDPESSAAGILAALGGLRPGEMLDRWRIAAIHEVDRGAIPVILARADGTTFQLDVLRRDPADPPPLACTDRLAVYLAGVPRGTRTPEDLGHAARVLADVMGGSEVEPPASLLTLGQRAPLLD